MRLRTLRAALSDASVSLKQAERRRIVLAARFYNRARDLPWLWPDCPAEYAASDSRVATWHILAELARRLRFQRRHAMGRPLLIGNLRIAMVAEAATLQRQTATRAVLLAAE